MSRHLDSPLARQDTRLDNIVETMIPISLETHLLDTGHFALETHGEEIASRIEEFLQKQKLAS